MTMIRQSLAFTVSALLIAQSTLGGQATAPAASPSPNSAQEAYVIEQSRTTLRFELPRRRTIALDIAGPAGTTADFFVLLDNRSGVAAVEGVMFISGDEALRRFGDTLPRAKFDATFPDTAPAKVLRRGTLSCAGGDRPASCRFSMMLPAAAQTAQQEGQSR